jgi:hypothetical protein
MVNILAGHQQATPFSPFASYGVGSSLPTFVGFQPAAAEKLMNWQIPAPNLSDEETKVQEILFFLSPLNF